jgi:hypothetical protein
MNPAAALVIRIILGVLAFFIADWLLPKLFAAIKFLPPDPILLIVSILIGLLVFFTWPLYYPYFTRRPA